MQWAIVFLIAVFLLITCQDNDRSARIAEKARIERIEKEADQRVEREVARRVEAEVAAKADALEQKYRVRQAQLRTIRAVGFILLAGGALGGLIWLQRNHAHVPPQPGERNLQMPTWLDHFALRPNRVLDLPPHQLPPSPASPAPQDAWNQTNSTPPRRRARRRRHRNRNRNRNQDHDETPSHR